MADVGWSAFCVRFDPYWHYTLICDCPPEAIGKDLLVRLMAGSAIIREQVSPDIQGFEHWRFDELFNERCSTDSVKLYPGPSGWEGCWMVMEIRVNFPNSEEILREFEDEDIDFERDAQAMLDVLECQ